MDGLAFRQPKQIAEILRSSPWVQTYEKVFCERVRALTEDGYMVRVWTQSPSLWLVRLHHMCNGNDIILKCYPMEKKVMQLTNHVKVYEEVF